MMIRRVREADCERIGELWAELVAYHVALDEAMPLPATDGKYRYAERVCAGIHDHYFVTFVAEDEAGQLCGFITGMMMDILPDTFVYQSAGVVGDLYVQPNTRRRGTGRALLAALLDWFSLRGLTSYEWYVAARNEAGIAFWRAVGGREVMLRMQASVPPSEDAS